jgi:hypothetical protein
MRFSYSVDDKDILMKNKTKLVSAVIPHKFTAEEFVKRYNDLCKETGFQIGYEPKWVQSKDTGDYRLIIASGVVLIPVENNDNSG